MRRRRRRWRRGIKKTLRRENNKNCGGEEIEKGDWGK